MRSPRRFTWTRRRTAGALLLALGGLACLSAGPGRSAPSSTSAPGAPPVLELRSGDLLFTYHLLSGTEGLFEVSTDPQFLTNLSRRRWRDGLILRRRLEQELGVDSLDDLLDPDDPTLRSLRGHGYL